MQPPLIVPQGQQMRRDRSSRAGAEATPAFGGVLVPPRRRQLVAAPAIPQAARRII